MIRFREQAMKLSNLVVASALALGSACLIGCESNNSSPDHGYAGGNGAFGENPAQPGERSGQRFNSSDSTSFNNGPTTQPTYSR